jgi:hypothetical protein
MNVDETDGVRTMTFCSAFAFNISFNNGPEIEPSKHVARTRHFEDVGADDLKGSNPCTYIGVVLVETHSFPPLGVLLLGRLLPLPYRHPLLHALTHGNDQTPKSSPVGERDFVGTHRALDCRYCNTLREFEVIKLCKRVNNIEWTDQSKQDSPRQCVGGGEEEEEEVKIVEEEAANGY